MQGRPWAAPGGAHTRIMKSLVNRYVDAMARSSELALAVPTRVAAWPAQATKRHSCTLAVAAVGCERQSAAGCTWSPRVVR